MERDVGTAATSSGGIHQSNQDMPVLKESVKANGISNPVDWAGEYGRAALQPTALGQLSSTISMQSGIALAKRQGTLLGKNPEGDLLPAFTPVDEAFVNSYSSQAKATLGLQVNSLMNQSEEMVNQNFKLSPQAIAQFQSQTGQGIVDILQHAPSTVKSEMENQYMGQLQDSTHQLNMKMIGQQKQDTKDAQDVYNNSVVKNSFNGAFLSSTPQSAQQAQTNLSDFKKDLARQRSAGIIDRKQEESLYASAKLNYYSGIFTKGAVDAKTKQDLPGYLRGMHDKLPNDLTPLEKVTVGQNVLQYMNAVHNEESQDNQLIVSELGRALTENTLTGSMLSQAESQLPPAEFNNFMSKMWAYKNTKGNERQVSEDLANNISNLYAMSQATDKQKNTAFQSLVAKSMQKDPDQDILLAEANIVRGAGGEIPAFTKQLNAMAMSGGPNELYRASRVLNSLSNDSPQNIASVDPKARAMAAVFEDLHEIGVDPEQAWNAARDQVLNKTKDQQEANEDSFKQYQKAHFSTPIDSQNRTKKLLNAGWFTHIPNLPQVSNRVMRAWEANFKLTNGNANAADKLTSQELERAYGDTKVNGVKQKVYLPVEKLAGVGDDATPIIHKDIMENISPQLQATEDAYKSGRIDYFYRIAEKKGDGPVKIEKVWRDSGKKKGLIQQFDIQITASPNMQLMNSSANPYSGFYDVGLIDKNGYPFPLENVSSSQNRFIGYKPNIRAIQDAYTRMHNNGLTMEANQRQQAEDFIAKHNAGPGFIEKARKKSQESDAKMMKQLTGEIQ